jgi:hypothetical protein
MWSREKSFVPCGEKTQVVQLVARHYTDRGAQASPIIGQYIPKLYNCLPFFFSMNIKRQGEVNISRPSA